jgi:hypothetical protein
MKITEKQSFCIHVTEKELTLLHKALAHSHCSKTDEMMSEDTKKELEPLISIVQKKLYGC